MTIFGVHVPMLGMAAIMATLGATIWGLVTRLPGHMWTCLLGWLTISMEVIGEDRLYDPVMFWITGLPYTTKARRLLATTGRSNNGSPAVIGDEQSSKSCRLVLAPGNHVFFHRHRLVWLTFSRAEAHSGGSAWRESLTIRLFTRDRRKLTEFIAEIEEAEEKSRRGKVTVFISNGDWWNVLQRSRGRTASGLFLPSGMWEDLRNDATRFLEREEWYRSVGIPYRRGYLLSGVPGSGKTSTAMALATELGLDLYVVNFKDENLTDRSLALLLLNAPPRRSLVLLEDIDTAFSDRASAPHSPYPEKLTLGGLLNALDGSLAGEGRIVVMTTNHRARLDEALVRPGRADRHFEFGYATGEQISRMSLKLTGEAHTPDFGAPVTMAQAQEYFASATLQEMSACA